MALGGREDQAEEPQGRESVSRGQSVPRAVSAVGAHSTAETLTSLRKCRLEERRHEHVDAHTRGRTWETLKLTAAWGWLAVQARGPRILPSVPRCAVGPPAPRALGQGQPPDLSAADPGRRWSVSGLSPRPRAWSRRFYGSLGCSLQTPTSVSFAGSELSLYGLLGKWLFPRTPQHNFTLKSYSDVSHPYIAPCTSPFSLGPRSAARAVR